MTAVDDHNSEAFQRELQQACALVESDPKAAEDRLRQMIEAHPDRPATYRHLAGMLRRLSREKDAERAEADGAEASARIPALAEAAGAINAGNLQAAERLVRSHLASDPDDPEALRLLAEIAAATNHASDAEALLRRVLALVPAFIRAYVNLATLLFPQGRSEEALALLEEALAREPGHEVVLSIKAAILIAERRMDEALATLDALLARAPGIAVAWINRGYVLKTVGQLDEAIVAYRKALELEPGNGFAWWGLANLRTVSLQAADIATMQRAVQQAPDSLNRLQLHFALGRALGDQDRFEESFRQFEAANALRRAIIPHDVRQVTEAVQKAEALFTPAFLEARAESGASAADPIFILGMPRSGSTLVEQILACHSQIEGAGELDALEKLVGGMAPGARPPGPGWLDALPELESEALRTLGEAYLAAARPHRATDRPFFTDKMPYNWQYVGLIHLILPNAKIIDVRRHPVGCCFSNFAMYFNRETAFASSLEDLGLYYRAYVRMMDHFDRMLPGRIHRVLYEDLVADLDGEVKRLLGYLGLPFEASCLRFHDNERAVHTPSAQQVRLPINREGLERWRSYEPWLGPLKQALGSVLDLYPRVPGEQVD